MAGNPGPYKHQSSSRWEKIKSEIGKTEAEMMEAAEEGGECL